MKLMATRSFKLYLLPLLLLSSACMHTMSYNAQRDARDVASLALSEQHSADASMRISVVPTFIANAVRSVSAGLATGTAFDPDAHIRRLRSSVTLGFRN